MLRSMLFGACFVVLCSGCASTSSFHELHSEGKNDAKLHRFEWALESFLAAEKIDPTHKQLQFDIALVLYRLGRYNESILYSNKILEKEPNNFWALRRKALSYRRLAEYEKSTALFEKIVQLDGNEYHAISIIAKNKCDQKDYDGCMKAIERFRSNISSLDRSILPEKEKASIRSIEKSMLALEATHRNTKN